MIQENICDNFSLNNEKYATGLCVECHFALRCLKTKECAPVQLCDLSERPTQWSEFPVRGCQIERSKAHSSSLPPCL